MSLVKDALIVEFKELASKAVEFKQKMDTAKTFAKREVYKKKLKKNNIRAAEVLSALEILMKKEEEQKAAGGVVNEALDLEGRAEAPSGDTSSVE